MSGGGSVATIGAARTGMMAAFDPDAPGDLHAHVLAVSKCNLTSMGPTLKYKTVGVSVNDPKGQPIETVKIEWAGTSTHSGDAIVAHESLSPGEREKRTRVEDVMEELVEVLTDGPRPAEQVYLTLGRSKTDGTLRRAKDQLGVLTEKGKGKGAAWFWRLPGPNLAPEA